MQSKWRAPACYVGVAVLCAVYLSIVPGVNLTDVCAGAGLGAAVMWAINEWETGKWNVPLPVQPALAALMPQPAASFAVAGDAAQMQAMALQAAPAPYAPSQQAAAPIPPAPHESAAQPQPALPDPEPRHRVDSGTATPDKMEKWEIDEKEPSWDPTALAETWAKLRAELSINPYRAPVSPELPRGAQFARNADAKGPRPAVTSFAKAQAQKSAQAPKTTSTAKSTGALSSAGSAAARPQPAGSTTAKPASYTLGSYGQNGGSSLLANLASAPGGTNAGSTSARKPAKAPEPARQTGSFLRPGAIRPR